MKILFEPGVSYKFKDLFVKFKDYPQQMIIINVEDLC